MQEIIRKQFEEHISIAIKSKEEVVIKVSKMAELIINAFKNGKRLYACGNGGSTCDAMHLVEELVAQYKNRRSPLPAHNLMDPSIITCWSNDESFQDIFRRQVEAYGREEDILIAISTSGNSENTYRAIIQAKQQKMIVISLLGKTGGRMKGLSDLDIIVPSNTTSRIQEVHILIIHSILEVIDKEIFGV